MPEEAKQESALSDDQIVENAMSEFAAKGENPEEPSPSKDNEQEQEQTENPDEDTPSQKSESGDKEDSDVPKGYHHDPAWKRLIDGRNEARSERDQLKKTVEDLTGKFKEVEKVISSPDYIRFSMKAQGYTDEAINAKLNSLGHDAPTADKLSMVAKSLNLRPEVLNAPFEEIYKGANVKTFINDIISILEVAKDKGLPKDVDDRIKSVEDNILKRDIKARSDQVIDTIQEIVKKEGQLDYKKDIHPLLNKYIDEAEANGKHVSPEELLSYFKDINHELFIEKANRDNRREERDVKKKDLRSIPNSSANRASNINFKWDSKKHDHENIDELLKAGGIV